MPRERRLGQLVLGATIALTVAACASSTGSSTSTDTSSMVTIATASTLTSIDGTLENYDEINQTIYSSLVALGPTGQTVPQLATSWTSNADATVWTFTLRPGVKFSDGSALTAADVVWTYQADMKNAKSLQNADVSYVKGITGSGNTVTMTLNAAVAPWPRLTALIPIVSQKAYQSMGATAFGSKPVGSGPYMVTNYDHVGTVTLKANPHYFGTAPTFSNVKVTAVDSDTTRLTGLQSGSYNVARITPTGEQSLNGSASVKTASIESDEVVYLGLNALTSPLTSVALRQAVSYAIDRSAITKSLFNGKANPVGQLVAPATVGYAKSVQAQAYDLAKAKSLVAASGYAGQTIYLDYPSDGVTPLPTQTAEAVANYLAKAGIHVKLRGTTQNTFLTNWFTKKLPGIYLFEFKPTTLDAQGVFTYLYNAKTGVALYNDPTMDALETRQASQTDSSQRLQTLTQLSQRSAQQGYYAPLFDTTALYGYTSSRLKATPRVDGDILPQELTKP